MSLPMSVPDVADVEVIRGRSAPPGAAPRLLVEAPHGATLRRHYEALAGRMVGALPPDLHEFFHVNTDVGSWEVGRQVAVDLVERDPTLAVLVVRCLVPRTLIDTNRRLEAAAGDLLQGGLTGAVPPYVTHPDDLGLLRARYGAYLEVAERAYALVCGGGGLALCQHTYGPVSLGIASVDRHIVDALREAHAPSAYATWPVRPEVDLITVDGDGRELAPPGSGPALVAAFAASGITAVIGRTYTLHPSTMGRVWTDRYPGRVLSLEIRRDLLVDAWRWNEEMTPLADRVRHLAGPLVAVLGGLLSAP